MSEDWGSNWPSDSDNDASENDDSPIIGLAVEVISRNKRVYLSLWDLLGWASSANLSDEDSREVRNFHNWLLEYDFDVMKIDGPDDDPAIEWFKVLLELLNHYGWDGQDGMDSWRTFLKEYIKFREEDEKGKVIT